MTRRVGLAQALINDPELILLDEPTSGLDPIGTREMKDLILKLRDQGKTIVMCSHLLADVQDVCDRIAILHQGELKELGRVDSLLTVQDVTQIRARGLTKQAEEEIRAVIARHGAKCLGSRIRRRRWKSCSSTSSATAKRVLVAERRRRIREKSFFNWRCPGDQRSALRERSGCSARGERSSRTNSSIHSISIAFIESSPP